MATKEDKKLAKLVDELIATRIESALHQKIQDEARRLLRARKTTANLRQKTKAVKALPAPEDDVIDAEVVG